MTYSAETIEVGQFSDVGLLVSENKEFSMNISSIVI